MDVSFILLNFKQRGLIKQCIKGIYKSRIILTYEIILVDNNSHDQCLELIHNDFPEIQTVQLEKNTGFAYGNNVGIKIAKGKYIIIINPDVAIIENSIEQMILYLEADPNIGILGPKLINPDGTLQYSCRKFPSYFIPLYRRTFFGALPFAVKSIDNYLMKDFQHNQKMKVDWLFGAFLVIRKKALDEVGIFDERFFLYYEDLDLCRRFWEMGWEVWYMPDVVLVHYHQKLSAQKFGFLSFFRKATRIHIYSAMKYFIKYFGSRLPKYNQIKCIY